MTKLKSSNFLTAWKKGVELHPEFFEIKSTIKSATSVYQLSLIEIDVFRNLFKYQSPGVKMFLYQMISFYDSGYDYIDNLQEKCLMSPANIHADTISHGLDAKHRTIICDLILNH